MALRSAFPDASPAKPVPVAWEALTDAPVGSVFGLSGEGVHGCFVLSAPGMASMKLGGQPEPLQKHMTYWQHRKVTLYLVLLGSGELPRDAQGKAAITRALHTARIPAARLVQEERVRPVITDDDIAKVLLAVLPRKVSPGFFTRVRTAADLAFYRWVVSRGVDPLSMDRRALVQHGARVRGIDNLTPEGRVRFFHEGEWQTAWGNAFGETAHAAALRAAVAQGIDVPAGVLASYGISTLAEHQTRQQVIALQKRVATATAAITEDLRARETVPYEAKFLSKHHEYTAVVKARGEHILVGVVRYEGERRWFIGESLIAMKGSTLLRVIPTEVVRGVVREHWKDLPVESLPSYLQPFGTTR